MGGRLVVGEQDTCRLPQYKEAVQVQPRPHSDLAQGDQERDGRGGRETRPQEIKDARGNGGHGKPRYGEARAIGTYTTRVY